MPSVRYARFPPRGVRGADPTVRSARYRTGDFSWDSFIKTSNEEALVIPLLEDKEFLPNLDAILAVEGLDAVCFGPTDYALSLGLNLLYDFNHPKIVEAFEAIVEKSKEKNLPVLSAVNPCTVEQAEKLINMGVKFLLMGVDIALIGAKFQEVMTDVVAKVK